MENKERPVGYTWLINELGLESVPLPHASYIGARARSDATRPSVVTEVFSQAYWPGEEPFDHMVFALKYDDLNLHLLGQAFRQLGAERMRDYIEAQPNGKYARQLGYLYEFLIGEQLALSVPVGGAYVDLLDPAHYLVAPKPVRSARWHINDNLLGSRRFCPVVRLIPAMRPLLDANLGETLAGFRDQVEPALYQRAVDYLYFKETRSSYDIEREKPTPDRELRFVRALHDAGKAPLEEALGEAALVAMQNLIVEARYARPSFRDDQNYVGESMPGRAPVVHYVCPPGDMVRDLMAGLIDCAQRTHGLHPVVRAALISFGFVFVHPFEDGNGRIHRYLIHDFLGRDGLVPPGMVLPVSAYMLHHPQEYERALEAFSKPLRTVVRIDLDDDEQLTVLNPDVSAGAWRYPDLTFQAHYLLHAVEQTISTELVTEILFIRGYDQARVVVREVVDMPNKKLDLIIKLMYQNRGTLAKGKRNLFRELSDEEVARIERAYAEAFADPGLGSAAGT